jgi:hypothetical protein
MIKQNNKIDHCGGQGVIEYILLMTAVIGVLLVFFARNGFFQRSYNNVLTIQADEITNSALTIFGR